jgi:hypothetical protein
VKKRLRIANDPSPSQGPLAALIESAVNLGRRRAGWWPLGEVVIFVGGAIALSRWLHPSDPLWVAGSFPWLWLITALVALRYGAMTGTAAMGLALFAWFIVTPELGALAFPRLNFLGGLILVLIAGEFSDVWNARLQRERAVNTYLDERLHALTHNHFLLRLSHERLEQELIARPQTLRESLSALRKPMAEDLMRGISLPGAQALLNLLVQSCRLEGASLHAMEHDRPVDAAIVSLGGDSLCVRSDPLVRAAIASGQLMHVQTETVVRDGDPSRYLICAPVVSSTGRWLAILLVRRMPFAALTSETLQFMTVLLAYYADEVDKTAITGTVLTQHPDCPAEFALELVRLRRVFAVSGVESSMVAFVFQRGPTPPEEWITRITRLFRSVDVAWAIKDLPAPTLLILLPLTGAAGIAGYLERLTGVIRDQYGSDFAQAGIAVHQAMIDSDVPQGQLAAFLERLRA